MQQTEPIITRFAFTQIEDTSDLLNIYIGKTTVKDASYDDPVWQIQRITVVSAGVTKSEFANNDASASYVWSIRSTYFGAGPAVSFASRYSIQCDGSNDYMDAGQSSNLLFRSALPFSVSAWINPDSVTTTRTIIGQYLSSGFFVYLMPTTGKLRFRMVVSTTSNDLNVETISTIPLNSWSHITCTYDGSRTAAGVNIYIDGEEAAVNVIANTLSSSPNAAVNWRIGSTAASSTYFSGYLDDVSVFNKVLSAAEALNIYGIGKPNDLSLYPFYSNCVGWWLMGDGTSFPNIPDVAAGNTAVMTNMTSGQIKLVAP